jgi:hypothetical protein
MALFFHIGINARRSNADGWGDTEYAGALARALRDQGHGAELFYRDEQPGLTGAGDVVIRIIGPHLDEPVPGVPNLLWIISPPNLAPLATLRRYQKVFFASVPMARIYQTLQIDASYLPQAVDVALFRPQQGDPQPPLYDVIFVGNRAPRAPRDNVRQAIAMGHDVKVWGQGWEGVIPAANHLGTRLSLQQLTEVYARSRVVLNSHMPAMAQMGFMSNRSFDAMACGACVISDRVVGFDDPTLPWLIQVKDDAGMAAALARCLGDGLGDGPDAPPARAAIAARVAQTYSFALRATVLAQTAQGLIGDGRAATPAFALRNARPGPQPRDLTLRDVAEEDSDPGDWLDSLIADHALTVTLHLSDPSFAPPGLSPSQAMRRAAIGIRRIGAVLARTQSFAGLNVLAPGPEARQGVIHAAMADHRAAQDLALHWNRDTSPEVMAQLCARARRLLDVSLEDRHPLGWSQARSDPSQKLIRFMANRPLYAHAPEGFSRDTGKRHLLLWPRKAAPEADKPVGVFLHLHYADLAPVFADRLSVLGVAHRLYVSTDTEDKAAAIRADLPQALVRVLPNRGRDVFPKLYGFGPEHEAHDIVLHLHGKKSPHAETLDQWLDHCLSSLLPSRDEVSRILSLFQSVPALGIVAPLTYQAVLGAAHWGDNFDIARELALRMRLTDPLPDDSALVFPVGSMFWGRTAALRPLLHLHLTETHFPPEAGQLDGTPAHAIERLFGVVCHATGHRLIRVAPSGSIAHKAHQVVVKSNGDLRSALQEGAFGA